MKYQLVVPSIAETQITGFRLGAEKIIGKAHWRMEYWAEEEMPRLYKNGEPFDLFNQPKMARRFTLDFARFYNQYAHGITPTQ